MEKKKRKNNTHKLTKKKGIRLIRYIIITAVLSIIVYFATFFITTKIMDATHKKETSNRNHNILENLEHIDSITIDKFITNLNQILQEEQLSYQIKNQFQRDNNAYMYTLDQEKEISIYLEPVKMMQDQKKEVLKLSALFFPKEAQNQEIVQNLLRVLLYTNNKNLTISDIDKLLVNIDSTEKTNKKGNITTSEFFQYKGLEISKRSTDTKVSYRIGRIME